MNYIPVIIDGNTIATLSEIQQFQIRGIKPARKYFQSYNLTLGPVAEYKSSNYIFTYLPERSRHLNSAEIGVMAEIKKQSPMKSIVFRFMLPISGGTIPRCRA